MAGMSWVLFAPANVKKSKQTSAMMMRNGAFPETRDAPKKPSRALFLTFGWAFFGTISMGVPDRVML